MRTSLATLALAGVLLFVFAVAQARRCPDVPAMTAAARNGDARAIGELRSYGPGGLKSFIEFSQEDLERYRASAAEGAGRFGAGDRWAGLVKAIDAIAGQYDAAWSELYWFTNFEEAKELAQRSGKPILSLRLLGRLDEELSCANSRFFRSTLYANERVAALLRDRFILHWESVRPAPVITIDYGDGRTLKTTITGNSIHYVLTPDGTVVDALPGLWSPEDFVAILTDAIHTANLVSENPDEVMVTLTQYWQGHLDGIDFRRKDHGILPGEPLAGRARPNGLAAQNLTVSKAMAELPLARRAGPRLDRRLAELGVDRWQVAGAAEPPCKFDSRSSALIRASSTNLTGAAHELQWAQTLMIFGRTVAADSLFNRLGLRRDVLAMLCQTPALAQDQTLLNARVYAEVFLTPDSDPWLGMYEPSTFSGLWGGPAHAAQSGAIAQLGD